MSTVFNNTSGLDVKESDFSTLREQPDGIKKEAIYNAKMGVVWAFVAIVPFMVLLWVCCFFLVNVKLGRKSALDDGVNQDIVCKEPYLWNLLRGRPIFEEGEKTSKTTVDEDSAAGRLC